MVVWQRFALAAVALVLVLGFAAYERDNQPTYDVWIELPPVKLPLPKARTYFAPGADGRAPLLVVIENTPESRPQSGLADACLVYAMPTEGQITRFVAGFCDEGPTMVGPVRSARRYMLEIARDLGGILVHAGYSTEALTMIREQKLPVINEFWTPGPFWRDATRDMPHNLYTGMDRLRAALEKRPIETQPRAAPYAFGNPAESGTPATTIDLDYAAPYGVRYRYDPTRRWYLREQDGQTHVDASGTPIAPVSVVVMFVRWSQVRERGIDSSKITLEGTGRLAVLTRGRITEGTWTRFGGAPLSLQDADRAPLVLPRGPVWIELFPVDRPFSAH